MIKTSDGTSYKRVGGLTGDRAPQTGFQRLRAIYTATGGETSIDLSALSPQISYTPGQAQISVQRSSGGTMISGIDFFETSATTIGFPTSDGLLNGEIVEIVREFAVSGVMAPTPRPDVYTATSTAGQTLVTATFSWQYNLNPTRAQGGVLVYLNGILQSRGVDYTEVNLGSGNTNQIQFTDPLLGTENIILLPAYQAIDTSAATSTFLGVQNAGIQSTLQAGTQSFVDQTSMISVPATSIVGRAKIPNIAADLRASMGLERIMTQSVYQLQSEFGPNGEPVFAAVNDSRDLIRFVGHWVNGNDNNGTRALAQTQGSFVEVTFYGTGLNWLSEGMELYTSSRVIQASVDGGAATTIPTETNAANTLHTRNYTHNVVRNIASGLSLGVHTVRLTLATGTYLNVHGFEILNASASVLVNPGIAYTGGSKAEAAQAKSIPYTTGVTGSRGGRQIIYIDSSGTISNAFQPVDTTQKNLTAADHSNEEVVRAYSWREFGAGRTDDFSRVSSTTSFGNTTFTLDDGTTTLSSTGAAVVTNYREGIRTVAGTSNAIAITFVGTGLDVLLDDDGNTNRAFSVSVDGTSIGTFANGSAAKVRQIKVVSGLPYGTHVVRFANNSAVFDSSGLLQFIVYQPKKPSIPAKAVELSDFNVMATFVANTVSDPFTISTGVLRKSAAREMTYIDGTGGTSSWALVGFSPLQVSGTETASDRSNATVRYTFFGTGFDLRSYRDTNRSSNISVQIDGLFATTANFPGATISTYGYSISNGILSQNGASQGGAGLVINGLPLGLHTVTFANNTAGSIFSIDSLDVISPIHSQKSNLSSDSQNTLPVGSCSLQDIRKTSMVKESFPAQKASALAIGSAGSPSTTSTTFVPVPDMSCTISLNEESLVRCLFNTNFYTNTVGQGAYFAIFIDGVQIGHINGSDASSIAYQMTISVERQAYLSAGTHKIDVCWKVTGGIGTCHNNYRTLFVEQK